MKQHIIAQKIRNLRKTISWKKAVLKRDEWNCNKCGDIELLEVHHKISVSEIIKSFNIKTIEDALECKLLFDMANGETLCSECHKKVHK